MIFGYFLQPLEKLAVQVKVLRIYHFFFHSFRNWKEEDRHCRVACMESIGIDRGIDNS